MTLKGQVSNIVSEPERRADDLADRVVAVRRTVEGWGSRITRWARKNPGAALAGAFALGLTLAKVARHG